MRNSAPTTYISGEEGPPRGRPSLRRLAPLVLLIGLAVLAALLVIPWAARAQSQEVTVTAAATGESPPAKATGLQASAEHDEVTLTWTASTDQTVTHYAVLRRDRGTDAVGVFHVIESNAGSGTGYTDGSVTAEGSYVYRVKAVSPTGVSQWSGYVRADTPVAPEPTPTAAPTATATPEPQPESTPTPEDLGPTNLTVALADGGGVTLGWTAPAEDANSVTGYEILRAVGEGGLTTLVDDTGSTVTSYTDATATEAGQTYAYQVKALRGEDRSQASSQTNIQIPHEPADLAPTGLTATLVNGGVALSWTAPAEDADSVTGYEILRAVGEGGLTTLVDDTGSTGTVYTDSGATTAGETYAYQVKALRGEDRSQASSQTNIQIPHEPADLAPTGLTATLVDGGVALGWTAPAENAGTVTGYEILRAVGEGNAATLVDDTGSTATTYTDATATELGETYAFQVRAIRGEDRSQASDRAAVQRPHDPVDLAPSNLSLSVSEDGGLTLSWSAPAADADSVAGYNIERAVGDGDPSTLVADTGSTGTTHTDSGATTAGETYAYRVRAIRGGVLSETSAGASFALPETLVSACEFDAEGSDLPADASTTCALEADGSVRGERGTAGDIDWYRAGLEAAATYQFDMRGRSTGEWKLVDGAPEFVSVGTLEDPKLLGIYDASGTLVPGTNSEVAGTGKDSRIASFKPDADGVYYISASAESGWTGTYELSVTVTAREQVSDPALLAPGDLTATTVDGGGVALTWSAPTEDADSVTGYEVLRAVGEGGLTTLVDDTGSTATSHADATATGAGETYAYQVKAIRGEARSQGSNTATLVTGEPAGTEGVQDVITTLVIIDDVEDTTPPIPQNLRAEANRNAIAVSWDPPETGSIVVTGYQLQRTITLDQGDSPLLLTTVDLLSVGPDQTSYTDTDAVAVDASGTVAYRVRTLSEEAQSDWSEPATAQPLGDTGELLWSAELTVGRLSGGQSGHRGYIPTLDQGGTLSSTVMTRDDGDFTISQFTLWPLTGRPSLLTLKMSAGDDATDAAAVAAVSQKPTFDYLLHVGEEQFDFDDASASHLARDTSPYRGRAIFTWSDRKLSWETGDVVALSLTKRYPLESVAVSQVASNQATVDVQFERGVGAHILHLRRRDTGADGVWRVSSVQVPGGATGVTVPLGGLAHGTTYEVQVSPEADSPAAHTWSTGRFTTPRRYIFLESNQNLGNVNGNPVVWQANLAVDTTGKFGDEYEDARREPHLWGGPGAGFDHVNWQTKDPEQWRDHRMVVLDLSGSHDGYIPDDHYQTAKRGSLTDPSDAARHVETFTYDGMTYNVRHVLLHDNSLRFGINIGWDSQEQRACLGKSGGCDVPFNWSLVVQKDGETETLTLDRADSAAGHARETLLCADHHSLSIPTRQPCNPIHPDYNFHSWGAGGMDWEHGDVVNLKLVKLPTNEVTGVSSVMKQTRNGATGETEYPGEATVSVTMDAPLGGTLHLRIKDRSSINLGSPWVERHGWWQRKVRIDPSPNPTLYLWEITGGQMRTYYVQATFNPHFSPTRPERGREAHTVRLYPENRFLTPAGKVLHSATMTVGTDTIGSDPVAGYSSLVATLGALTGDSFDFDGSTIQVRALTLFEGDVSLALSSLPDADYVLQVDDVAFDSTDGTLSTAVNTRTWAAGSLAWTNGQQVAVKIRRASGS